MINYNIKGKGGEGRKAEGSSSAGLLEFSLAGPAVLRIASSTALGSSGERLGGRLP